MPKPVPDKEFDLRYTIHVKTVGGEKKRRVADIGRVIARFGWLSFGDRFSMTNHKGEPITFDPNEHDFGIGEN